jgi:hypothetical protein
MRNLLRKFFFGGTILPPKGPDLLRKIELKRPAAPKKPWNIHNLEFRLIYTFLFSLSSCKYWIFLDYSPRGWSGDHFRSKELTFKLSLAIMKRLRKSMEGRVDGP